MCIRDRASQRGIQCIFDAQEHACHTGQQAGDDKCELDDPGRIDPHKLSRCLLYTSIRRLVLRTVLLRRRSVGLLQKRRKFAAVGRREHHLQFVGEMCIRDRGNINLNGNGDVLSQLMGLMHPGTAS